MPEDAYPTPVYIGREPASRAFTPEPSSEKPPIILETDELEAFRLVDLEQLTQEDDRSICIWVGFFFFYNKMASYEEGDLIRIFGEDCIEYRRKMGK